MDWTLSEIKHMPHTAKVSRVIAAGGDPSELESAANKSFVVLAPTLAVREGRSNPSVRYVPVRIQITHPHPYLIAICLAFE